MGQTANTSSPSPRPYRGRESHKLCSYGPAIPVRASHTSQVEDAQRPGRSPPGGIAPVVGTLVDLGTLKGGCPRGGCGDQRGQCRG